MPEIKTRPLTEKYCWQCGKEITHGGQFCHYCGADLGPQTPKEETEQIIFQITPSYYRVGKSYLIAIIFSLVAAALFGYFGGGFGGVLIAAAILFCFPFYRQLQRRRTHYTLTSQRLEIETGIISRTARHIPLISVRNVTTQSSLLKRLCGIGDVLIDSAATAGKIPLRNVRHPRKFADLILTQLHRRNLANRES
jgi:membrane protein YdbS with pleckstrin-like domain